MKTFFSILFVALLFGCAPAPQPAKHYSITTNGGKAYVAEGTNRYLLITEPWGAKQ